MKRMNVFFAVCIIATAEFMFVGCGAKKETGNAQTEKNVVYKDTLNVAYNAQPATFDPMVTGASATAEFCRLVFESLFEMDSNGDPKPQLCESYTKSDDNKDWTFNLRKGVLFHNGQEMKAVDVAASLNRWIKKNTIIQRSIKDGEQFKADGDYTVRIKLDNPCLLLPYMIAQFSQFAAVLPASVIKEAGDKTLKFDQLIGTGSFKFVEWSVDHYVKLERFDGYKPFTKERDGAWGDRTAYVKTVNLYFVSDPQTRINGLETGEYDIATYLGLNDVPRLKAMKDVTMMAETCNMLTITMNKSKDSIMHNVKWRQIIGYAVNLDDIMEGAVPTIDGYKAYTASPEYFKSDSPWYSGAKQTISYNPEKAKEMLKEIGYDGTPLKMLTTEVYPELYNSTLVMKQQLESAGINVDLELLDWGTMLTRLGQTTTFDLYPMGYPFADNPASNMTLMKTNAAGFTNDPHLNDLMIQMQSLKSFDAAKEFWRTTIEPYCAEQVFIINLGSYDSVYGVSSKVTGFKPYFGMMLWGVKVTR